MEIPGLINQSFKRVITKKTLGEVFEKVNSDGYATDRTLMFQLLFISDVNFLLLIEYICVRALLSLKAIHISRYQKYFSDHFVCEHSQELHMQRIFK